MIPAVHQVDRAVGRTASDKNSLRSRIVLTANESRYRRGASGQHNKLSRDPSIEYEIDDTFTIDHLPNGGRLRFSHRDAPLNFDLLRHRADFKREIDSWVHIDLQYDPLLNGGLKARSAYLN